MSEDSTQWELRHENVLLGRLTSYAWDFPWLDCEFEPTAAFEQYRDLFEDEFRLLNPEMESDEHREAWEAAFNKIEAARIWFAPVDDAAHDLRAHLLDLGKRRPWICAILGA